MSAPSVRESAAGTPAPPERSCVACRRRRPQAELLRLARTPEGIVPDPRRRLPGRGAYVCPDRPECREAKRLRRFARAEADALAARLSDVPLVRPAGRE